MDYLKIKEQLEVEIEKLLELSTNKNKTDDVVGFHKFTAMSDHFSNADTFSKTIIDKLNEILEKNNINIEGDDEKEKLVDFIRPTILESIQKFLLN